MLFLVLLFVLVWSLFIVSVVKDKRLFGFYFKGLSSFLFILTFAFGTYKYFIVNNELSLLLNTEFKYSICIFIGLVSGLIGDLFLELMHVDKTKSKTIIIAFGTIIFLIGHLFYFTGLITIAKFSYVSVIIGLVMAIVVYFGGKLMKLNMGKLSLLMYLYSFLIFTMIGQAIMNGFYFNFNSFSLVFMIGAILFGVSDLLLAPLYFGGEDKNSIVVANLTTYYYGQLLIALAIYFL